MNYSSPRPHSEALFAAARQYMPGGVNSPVRAFRGVGGTPVFIERAQGAILTDADGHPYLDYINSWGPAILGHAYPPVVEAIREQAARGLSFGAPTAWETGMARLIVASVPGIGQVRMVNSGTEACMSAVRLARGYTGRQKLIKFAGNYHGHSDAFLIKAGSGALTLGVPSSPGVPPGVSQDTLLARYNDLDSVAALFARHPGEIAGVIVEPVAGNMGCIPPVPGFLEGLRDLCTAGEALLIFDEVMTGFRLALGGAQERLGVVADLVTFGKVIGGGMPVGAFGGRTEIMQHLAPEGPVYQAGTLSGNPLAMVAGLATLGCLRDDPGIYRRLDQRTEALAAGLRHCLGQRGIAHQINQIGSMISLHFCEAPVRDFETAMPGDNARFRAFFHGMLDRGIYLPPSAYESWFLSDALTGAQIDQTLAAAADVVDGAAFRQAGL